jgi:hypothetical protein
MTDASISHPAKKEKSRTGSIEHENHVLSESFTGTQSPHKDVQYSIL